MGESSPCRPSFLLRRAQQALWIPRPPDGQRRQQPASRCLAKSSRAYAGPDERPGRGGRKFSGIRPSATGGICPTTSVARPSSITTTSICPISPENVGSGPHAPHDHGGDGTCSDDRPRASRGGTRRSCGKRPHTLGGDGRVVSTTVGPLVNSHDGHGTSLREGVFGVPEPRACDAPGQFLDRSLLGLVCRLEHVPEV